MSTKEEVEEKESKEVKEEEEETSHPAPPEGVLCKWITPDNSERLGLKSEDGSFVEHKTFTLDFIKDHVQNFGNFSEFKDVLPLLSEYPQDQEVLVSVDEKKTYGEKFLFYHTVDSKETYFKNREERLKKEEEEERLRREEEERVRKQEEAERNAVWEPKDLVASKILPEPQEGTIEEMSLLAIEPQRKRIRFVASARRRDVDKPYTFADHDGPTKEFRSKMDPNFELKRKVVDLGLQDA